MCAGNPWNLRDTGRLSKLTALQTLSENGVWQTGWQWKKSIYVTSKCRKLMGLLCWMTQRNPQPLPCRNPQVGEETGKYVPVTAILCLHEPVINLLELRLTLKKSQSEKAVLLIWLNLVSYPIFWGFRKTSDTIRTFFLMVRVRLAAMMWNLFFLGHKNNDSLYLFFVKSFTMNDQNLLYTNKCFIMSLLRKTLHHTWGTTRQMDLTNSQIFHNRKSHDFALTGV